MNADTGVSRSPDMSNGGFTPSPFAAHKAKNPSSGLPEMGFVLEKS
jgi:hypothetical protein